MSNYKIIITHPGSISDFSITEENVDVLHFPMLKINFLDNLNYINIKSYDYIIFSSKYSIEAFMRNNKINVRNISALCTGHKVKEKLLNLGFNVAFCSSKSYKKNFINEILKTEIIDGKNILYLSGNLSDNMLQKSLEEICFLTQCEVYKTVLNKEYSSQINYYLTKAKTICVFTSPSAFDAFVDLYDVSNTKIAAIGKTTSNYIMKKNHQVDIISKEQTYSSLSLEINKFLIEQTIN